MTPVNAVWHRPAVSKYPWKNQSWPGAGGMYSCSISPVLVSSAQAQISCSSDGVRTIVVLRSCWPAVPRQGVVSFAMSGKPAWAAKLAASPGDQASMACGVGTPRSRQSWNIEYLPASRRGRSAGGWRERVRLAQHVPVLGQEDRARVVRRVQHRPAPDLAGQVEQAGQGPLRIIGTGLPEEAAGQVAGTRGGGPRPLVHAVHRHAQPSQAADHAEAAVVQHVLVELEHHRGGTPVGRTKIGDHRGGPHTTTRWAAP